MTELPHFDSDGHPHMVDVGAKPSTERLAKASCEVSMLESTSALIQDQKVQKGNVVEVARIAGIMAAKKTSELIPLCHPLALDSVEIDIQFRDPQTMVIVATVASFGKTGVEMEALHCVTTAALTVYDMCKSVDRAMTIGPARLEEKSGGKSGHFVRDPN